MNYSFEELVGRGVPKSNDFVGMSVGMSFDSRCGGAKYDGTGSADRAITGLNVCGEQWG